MIPCTAGPQCKHHGQHHPSLLATSSTNSATTTALLPTVASSTANQPTVVWQPVTLQLGAGPTPTMAPVAYYQHQPGLPTPSQPSGYVWTATPMYNQLQSTSQQQPAATPYVTYQPPAQAQPQTSYPPNGMLLLRPMHRQSQQQRAYNSLNRLNHSTPPVIRNLMHKLVFVLFSSGHIP